jgi:hypothetical protein
MDMAVCNYLTNVLRKSRRGIDSSATAYLVIDQADIIAAAGQLEAGVAMAGFAKDGLAQ